ncbi:tetratricopeptide repeat protein [Rufibacter sediminis]|uniref:histidine kinase n=1 Tax=Rufibacter sediminis TaxID=2762756 RepID=A0ABR6VVB7_9BACT|nr:tetratricopeptide repeat-containing sensor histidine kinase [Rufibacter sediminis]MBC3541142.1 tetratricopeptide repeat-containing sensor histidine kinase [Rufibacter sediminis]
MRFLLILVLLLPGRLFAQQNQVEELKQRLAAASSDTARVNIGCALSREYMLSDVLKAMQQARSSQELAKKAKYLKGEAEAIGLIGHGHLVLGEFDKAFPYFYTSLRIASQLKDTTLLVTTYNNLGVLCYRTKDEKRALQNYHLAQSLALKTNNQNGLGRVYNNLGNIYETRKDFATALTYYQKATNIHRQSGNRKSYGVGLANIGIAHNFMGKPAQGLPYLQEALQIDEELGNNMNKTVTLGGIANIYQSLKQPQRALHYARQSYEVAVGTVSSKKIMAAAQRLADLYASVKDFENAYKYQTIFTQEDLKLNLDQQNRKAAEIISKFENSQQELENIKLKAQQRIQALDIAQQQKTMWFEGAILLLLLLLVIGLYLSKQKFKNLSRQLQEATSLLLQKNQEITAQKEEITKQAAILESNNAQLDRHNSFKSKVFSIVSHDLRSPFNSIQGILQLVQNRSLSEGEVKRFFALLGKNMEVVVKMMDNLLFWSKAQMQGSSLELHPVRLHDMVNETLHVLEAQASAKEVRLFNGVNQQLTINTDKERLSFVLRNMVANAIKFSFAGGEVTLEAHEQEKGISFVVTDAGKGISESNLAKLFSGKRFTTPGTALEQGTGLGLLLSKELVESLNGKITVESVQNQGSTFTIYLPCTVRQEDAEVVLEEELETS